MRQAHASSRLAGMVLGVAIALQMSAVHSAGAATFPAEGTSATFQWDATRQGNALGYEVFLSRDGGPFLRIPANYTPLPRVTVTGRYGESVQIVVRALAAGGVTSGFSTESDPVVFVPGRRQGPGSEGGVPAGRTDFNGDGHEDVLWLDESTGLYTVWLMHDGALVWEETLPPLDPGWTIVGVGDLDGDGRSDAVLSSPALARNAAWLLRGARVQGKWSLPGNSFGWFITAVADLDGDGRAEVVWSGARPDGSTGNVAWFVHGSNDVVQANLPSATRGWFVRGVGDFDGDGAADLLIHNPASGGAALWHFDPRLAVSQTMLPSASASMRLGAISDLDGDGISDIAWVDAGDPRSITVWTVQGASVRPQVFIGPTQSRFAGLRDLDADGTADLLWHREDDAAVEAWLRGPGGVHTPHAAWAAPETWQSLR